MFKFNENFFQLIKIVEEVSSVDIIYILKIIVLKVEKS